LLGSLALVASVWCLVLIGHVLSERLDHEVWTACAFAAAVLIVVAVRPRRPSSAPVVPVLLGLGSGFVSYPAWVTTIWVTGSALGLPADTPPPNSARGLSILLATVVLAPIFEELLYRERLLTLLQARFGRSLAVVLSSSLFAISHIRPFSVLGCFLIGMTLGAVYLASGSVALCISMHAGFNLASVACGLPPEAYALSPMGSALAGWGLTLLGVVLARRPLLGSMRLGHVASRGSG